MNVLVIGATGYTGSHLVRALLAHGHRVRGLTRHIERGMSLEKEGMELRVGDLLHPESLHGIAHDVEIIFNLAANCRLDPPEAKKILTDGARNLFRQADRAALQKYIWASNLAVYGFPAATARLDEASPLKPAYALGKTTVDAENLARENVPAIAVRVSSVYGLGRDSLAALREGRIRLLNGGENWTSRIHVADLIQVLLAAMTRATPGSVYLAADDLPTVQREFFQELAAAAGAAMPLALELNAARAFGAFGRAMNALAGERQYSLNENVIGLTSGNYFCLNNKIKNELGVSLQYPTFREGYKEIFETTQRA